LVYKLQLWLRPPLVFRATMIVYDPPPIPLLPLADPSQHQSKTCPLRHPRNRVVNSPQHPGRIWSHLCKKTPLFSQLFPCLSGACRGKMISFSIKQRRNRRFLTCHVCFLHHNRSHALLQIQHRVQATHNLPSQRKNSAGNQMNYWKKRTIARSRYPHRHPRCRSLSCTRPLSPHTPGVRCPLM
jgi:hypothetical protein